MASFFVSVVLSFFEEDFSSDAHDCIKVNAVINNMAFVISVDLVIKYRRFYCYPVPITIGIVQENLLCQ